MLVKTLSDLVFRIREISSGRSELLSFRSQGRRETLSTADFLRGIHSLALALETRGLTRGDRVAIFSDNRPEWHIVDFACQLLGVPSIPVLPELSKQQIGFILRNSACRWVFYDTREKRELLLSLESTLTSPPELAAFVADATAPAGITITRLMGEGAARQGDVPIERFRGLVGEHDPASLIYANSPSGDPDKMLLTHLDLITQALTRGEVFELSQSDQAVSCLPLAHRFQRSIDHLCFYRGAAIHYLSSLDEMPEELAREQPSLLTAAPEIYEQLFLKILTSVELESPPRRWLFRRAVDISERHAAAKQGGVVGPLLTLQRSFARRLVFRRIYQRFGGHLRLAICGGPPLQSEVSHFFEALGMLVFQHAASETRPGVSPASEPPP